MELRSGGERGGGEGGSMERHESGAKGEVEGERRGMDIEEEEWE